MGYTSTAIKGISWMSSFRIVTRVLSFLKIIVLARVLTPSQFGIFGIASLVLAFLEMVTETGINIFLIQTKKDINEYINSAWVISIIRGIMICLIIIALSPLISLFFRTQEAQSVVLLISLVALIRGFINPSVVKLQKDLQFHKEFWFRSAIFFFDAVVSIVLALITQSVYSLIWGQIAGALLELFLSFVLFKPYPNFKCSRFQILEILHHGKWVTAYGIFNYIAQEGDNIVVGRLIGPSALGIYQMAYKVAILPISEVTDVVSKVVFPVYTKIENDRKRLKRAFKKSTLIISITTITIGIVIFLFPREITLLLLGPKWVAAAEVLRILAFYGVLRAISGSASALLLAVGKQQYVTAMTFVRFAVLALTIYPLVKIMGLEGAAYAALLSVLFEIPVISYFIVRVFRIKS